MNRENALQELEEKIGYKFKDSNLIFCSMSHSSYANEHKNKGYKSNERLEFLGDAVLELVSSDFLYRHFNKLPEGELTKKRASMVCESTLALCAHEIELEKYLLLGKGEEATGGRGRDSIISDAMESLIGAIYLDGGFASAKEFINKFILEDISDKQLFFDSKTILQEVVQRDYTKDLSYELLAEEGPDHNKKFLVRALIGDREVGRGVGKTKKSAEQMAAYQTLLRIKKKKNR